MRLFSRRRSILTPWRGRPGSYRSRGVIVRGEIVYYGVRKDSHGAGDYSWSTWRVPYDPEKLVSVPVIPEAVGRGFSTRKRAYAKAEADAAKP